MTSIHNASLAAGASSAELTVSALEPHGVNASVPCEIYSKNATTGTLHPLVAVRDSAAIIIYPTSDVLVIKNVSTAAGYVQVTAK